MDDSCGAVSPVLATCDIVETVCRLQCVSVLNTLQKNLTPADSTLSSSALREDYAEILAILGVFFFHLFIIPQTLSPWIGLKLSSVFADHIIDRSKHRCYEHVVDVVS